MAKKKRIKLLIFDLGGVLVHGGYLEFINHYCMACFTPAGQKKILALERQVNLGNLTERQFYRALQTVFGIHLTPQRMHYLIVNRVRKDKSLLKFIKKLGRRQVAIFTNSIGHMALEVLRLKRIPARKLFKKVFISTKLHLVKPDAEAYQYILKKMKVRPAEAVMVDDRPLNIKGARKVGMEGIVYKNSTQFRRAIKKYEFV